MRIANLEFRNVYFLAGKQNSVLILVNKNGFAKGTFPGYYPPDYQWSNSGYREPFMQDSVYHGHILGGASVISASLFQQIASTADWYCGTYKISGGKYSGWTLKLYTNGSLGLIPRGGSKETKAGIHFLTDDPSIYIEIDGEQTMMWSDGDWHIFSEGCTLRKQ